MIRDIKFVSKKYKWGWSLWIQVNGRKTLLADKLESKEAVNQLIHSLPNVETTYELQKPKDIKKTVQHTCPKCNQSNSFNVKDSVKERNVEWLMCSFCNKPSGTNEWLKERGN